MKAFPFSANLFWDSNLADIDLEKNKHYVIGRVLTRGRLSDFETLLALYPTEQIIGGIIKSKEMDPKTAHFCCWYFKISPAQVHVSSFYR